MGKRKSANNFRRRSRENRCSNRDYYLANPTPQITDWLEIEKRLVRFISDPAAAIRYDFVPLYNYVLCISILQLIGASNEEADFSLNNTPFTNIQQQQQLYQIPTYPTYVGTSNKGTSGLSPLPVCKKKRRNKAKTGTYATQTVSFISSGKMESEPQVMPFDELKLRHQTASSSSYGAFEMHTTGFGSRMMAKMGYVDGGGLGKDGRGIAEPIQAIQRPKSLGLGAMAPETEPVDTTPPQRFNRSTGQSSRSTESRGKSGNAQFRSFERHTKGFGSKMMAKMGYVEGTGLGRDSQGIVDPLVASRLPKSRGLGANG